MTDLGISNEEIPTGEGTGTVPDQDTSPGHNPAWDTVLNVLPTQFHDVVKPHFEQWDRSAQDRITSLSTELSGYSSYQPLVQYGVSMEDVAQGLRLMQAVNNNPREIYDALGQAYGYGVAQQQLAAGNIPGAENGTVQQMTGQQQDYTQQQQMQQPNDPRVDRLQQGVDLMANIILQQQEAERAVQADADLDNELGGLKQKYGDFDERFVLAYMAQGMSGEQAAQHFSNLKNEMLTNNPRPYAPGILGSSSGNGTGIPSNAIDPTQLSNKETRNLVAQMLAAAQRGNQS